VKAADLASPVQATWAGTTCVDPINRTCIRLSFATAAGMVRLELSKADARHVAETVLEYLAMDALRDVLPLAHDAVRRHAMQRVREALYTNSHSLRSSGAPSVDGSMPDDGQKV